MGEPETRHDPSRRGSAAFFIPQNRLLPAVCPQCGAAGSVPFPIPADQAERKLLVHLCDLCASHAARQATLRFAWFTAAVVVSISVASAMTFVWGERGRALQFMLLALISLGLGQLARTRSRAHEVRLRIANVQLDPGDLEQQLLISHSPWLNQALTRLDFVALERDRLRVVQQPLTASWSSWLIPALPLLFSCVWWLALQGLSRASVYVVNMGPGPVVLLLDERRQSTVAATRFEQPNLGYRHEVVAGAHVVRLVTSQGETVHLSEQRLLPGQTLLLLRLLPGSCVWEERLDYEHPGSPSAWSLLASRTQAVLLKHLVDAWFTPLADGSGSAAPPLQVVPLAEAAPGTRTALRLLPCRSPGEVR